MSEKMVTLTLAHPLEEEGAKRVRAKQIRDYQVGEKISVPYHEARGIISAGYAAGIDPEDIEQVQEALATAATSTAAGKQTVKADKP
ncbi:hypothetical protein AB0395_21710 [Streptosporangium sp. NPDC051023]|uniref:hypothetical protein n=1 Tax=Streptosporangium sp. NPDC051023 TaxID=3155410 RepID=UPI003450E275